MLTVKEAVAQAKQHAQDVFGESGIVDMLLEEVDFDDAPPTWKVTLSFIRPEQAHSPLLTARFMRIFKVVQMDAATGALLRVTHRSSGLAA
jgi:hypothetical protein